MTINRPFPYLNGFDELALAKASAASKSFLLVNF